MGAIKVNLSDETEKAFRMAAMRLYGYGKGALSTAADKALMHWVSEVTEAIAVVGMLEDPVSAIDGMLSHVKKGGVELQHEARKIRAKKALKYAR
ncbi:MAG: hypothetical protein HYY68_06415 [Thaumarchaeota archaeon]|nr:hypothetical protein [Nitrososphaerota archaeon]